MISNERAPRTRAAKRIRKMIKLDDEHWQMAEALMQDEHRTFNNLVDVLLADRHRRKFGRKEVTS